MKIHKRSVIIIKSTNKDSDEKNNLNKKDSKNNILPKTIKLFFNKKPSSNSLNNKKLKLPFLPSLHHS